MAGGVGVNNEQLKQQQQYLNMRGAQMAEQSAGQKTELGPQPKAQGSKKQMIGTVIGIAAVFAALMVLKALHIL